MTRPQLFQNYDCCRVDDPHTEQNDFSEEERIAAARMRTTLGAVCI